jgi:hypothetical protein
LTTQDRIALVEIIKNIKEEEAQELKRTRESGQTMSRPSTSRPSPQRFSSRNPQMPKFPKK